MIAGPASERVRRTRLLFFGLLIALLTVAIPSISTAMPTNTGFSATSVATSPNHTVELAIPPAAIGDLLIVCASGGYQQAIEAGPGVSFASVRGEHLAINYRTIDGYEQGPIRITLEPSDTPNAGASAAVTGVVPAQGQRISIRNGMAAISQVSSTIIPAYPPTTSGAAQFFCTHLDTDVPDAFASTPDDRGATLVQSTRPPFTFPFDLDLYQRDIYAPWPSLQVNYFDAVPTQLRSQAASIGLDSAPPSRPDAPSGVAARAGDGTVSVTWVPPPLNGGRAIVDYRVVLIPGDYTCFANHPETSCTISGLPNGVTYSVAVTARSELGVSDPASGLNVTPTAPLGILAFRPDAGLTALLTALDEQIPELRVLAVDADNQTYTQPECPEDQIPLPDRRTDYLALLSGSQYTTTAGELAGPYSPPCSPDAITSWGK